MDWEEVDKNDYIARTSDGFLLRVEKLDRKRWWWNVYNKNNSSNTSASDVDYYPMSKKEAFAAVLAVYRHILSQTKQD